MENFMRKLFVFTLGMVFVTMTGCAAAPPIVVALKVPIGSNGTLTAQSDGRVLVEFK